MRLRTVVVFVGMLVIGACILGCGTSTRATVPSPGPGFATFTSKDGVFGLNHPAPWSSGPVTQSPVVNGEVFESPDKGSYFMVLPLNQRVAVTQYGDFTSTFASGFGGSNTQISSSTTTTSFAGKTWTEVDGTTSLNDTASDLKVYGTALSGNTLFIVTIAPTVTASTVNSTDFQPMLSSFTLLKQR